MGIYLIYLLVDIFVPLTPENYVTGAVFLVVMFYLSQYIFLAVHKWIAMNISKTQVKKMKINSTSWLIKELEAIKEKTSNLVITNALNEAKKEINKISSIYKDLDKVEKEQLNRKISEELKGLILKYESLTTENKKEYETKIKERIEMISEYIKTKNNEKTNTEANEMDQLLKKFDEV